MNLPSLESGPRFLAGSLRRHTKRRLSDGCQKQGVSGWQSLQVPNPEVFVIRAGKVWLRSLAQAPLPHLLFSLCHLPRWLCDIPSTQGNPKWNTGFRQPPATSFLFPPHPDTTFGFLAKCQLLLERKPLGAGARGGTRSRRLHSSRTQSSKPDHPANLWHDCLSVA